MIKSDIIVSNTAAQVGSREPDAATPMADDTSGSHLSSNDEREYAPYQELDLSNDWRSTAIMTDGKHPRLDKTSLFNTILFLENIFPDVFVLNEFSDEIFLVECPPWCNKADFSPRPYQQHDIVHLASALEKHGIASDLKRANSAINVVARKNSIHPVRARFDKMAWDGIPRLKTWLSDITASEQDSSYLARIGASWLVAGVARIYAPGTKFDHMLVLEGAGGIGKSLMFKLLATFGDEKKIAYFSDSIALDKVTHPASIAKMQGKLIIEFAELDGMNKSEDSTLKNFLAQTQDEVQKKFENPVTVYQRQCLFGGTTNEDEYLRDTTGNRRYWPVKAKKINIDLLKEIQPQLWAEAIHLYKSGYEFFINDKDPIYDVFLQEQSMRLNSDPWEDIIEAEILGLPYVYGSQVLAKVVTDISKRDGYAQRRVAGVLRKLGYKSIVRKASNGKTERRWERTITETLADIPDIPFE